MSGAGENNTATFQVQLYEKENKIKFSYMDINFGNDMYDNGASATIGIKDGTGNFWRDYSYDKLTKKYSHDGLTNNRDLNLVGDLVLQNGVVKSGENKKFSSINTITVGPSFVIESGASVSFETVKRIVLKPGFNAKKGSGFSTKLGN